MSTKHLRNISIAKFEAFLELAGCSHIRDSGGHYIYSRSDLSRSLTFQSHVDPVPEFIIRSNLRTLGYSKKDFFNILESKVKVQKNGGKYELVSIN